MNFFEIRDLLDKLNNILNDSNYFQDCQVKAVLFLYRITYKKVYLNQLIDLVECGQETNRELLRNLLKVNANAIECFEAKELIKYR